jgi:hypothetical protein
VYERTPSLFEGVDTIKNYFKYGAYKYEKGFQILLLLCKTISPNYFFLQIISTIIDIYIVFYLFERYIPNRIVFGFFCFLIFSGFSMEINALRNSKGIMIFLLSIKFIFEKKPLKYLTTNVIGSLFHTSSLIYLPLYFILNKRYSRKLIFVLFVIGNIVFFLNVSWLKGILLNTISIFNNNSYIIHAIEIYLDSEFQSANYGFSLGYFERFFSFFFVFYYYDKLIKKSSYNIVFLNSAFILWFVYLFCSEMRIIPSRVSVLFFFSYWILFPQLYEIMHKRNKSILLFILLFYGSIKMIKDNSNILNMYENILLPHSSYEYRTMTARSYLNDYRNQIMRDE